jgi:hypothetical protein
MQSPRGLCVRVAAQLVDAVSDNAFDARLAFLGTGDVAVVRNDDHDRPLLSQARNEAESCGRVIGENVSLAPFGDLSRGTRHGPLHQTSSDTAGAP